MKEFFYKISSVVLAFIVLFSSFSFVVHKHLCGDVVVDVSYVIEADSCGMDMNECTSNSSQKSVEKEPCCKDVSKIIEGNSNEQLALQGLEIEQVQFLNAFVNSYTDLFERLDVKSHSFHEYSPPLVVKDIQVLYDTFLI